MEAEQEQLYGFLLLAIGMAVPLWIFIIYPYWLADFIQKRKSRQVVMERVPVRLPPKRK